MTSQPYVPFYTSDFLGGTSGMTSSTRGVYITLLCLMYENEAPLGQSWDTLSRRCGCTLPAFKKAIEALADDGKLDVSGAGLWSEKCDKHIAQRRDRSGSAKAAANKRWEKIKQKQGGVNADALSAQCQPEPEPEPIEKEPIGSQKNDLFQSSDEVDLPSRPETKRKKIKRAVSLPPDWVPNDSNINFAISKQFTHEEINHEADQFRDHHLAKGTTFKDWDAGWRTWINNAIKFASRSQAFPTRPNGHGQESGIVGAVMRRRAGGQV